jgi:hypothetical protein
MNDGMEEWFGREILEEKIEEWSFERIICFLLAK